MKNKKNLIWIALVAILLVVILLIVFGKKDDTTPSIGNNVATPTLSLEITKIPHSILTSTPKVDKEDVIPTAPIVGDDENEDKPNKDDAIDFPNDDVEPTKAPSLVTPRPNVTLEPTKAPQISEAPKATSTPIPTQKVTSTPTPTPIVTQKPIITPSVGDDSGDTIKLGAIGVEVPKRDSFNHEALENSKTKTWYGDVDDTKSGQALLDKLDEIKHTLEDKKVIAMNDQAFLYTDNVITFDYIMKGANSNFELYRDTKNGEYVLEINSPLDYDYYHHYDVDWAPYSRDIVKSMLAIILDGSDVENVFNYIMVGLYEDSKVLNTSKYKDVGNVQIRFDENFYYEGNNVHVAFHIKSK